MQGKQTLLGVAFDHFDNDREELLQISDSNITCRESCCRTHFFLLGSEVIDNKKENVPLIRHVTDGIHISIIYVFGKKLELA